jgi:uncharacterized protein DUF6968
MAAPEPAPIATRRLALIPSRRPVLVELDAPSQRRGGEWACAYRIKGLGRTRAGRSHGTDSLQALQLAIEAVRRELEPFGPRLTWSGEAGELGLPAPVPDYFGGEFRRRMERLVQLETEREARRLKAPEAR